VSEHWRFPGVFLLLPVIMVAMLALG
jgi:hypothetical protein